MHVFKREANGKLLKQDEFQSLRLIDNLEFDTASGLITAGGIPSGLQSLTFLSGDESAKVYGSGLKISLLGTNHTDFSSNSQAEVVFVSGEYGKTLRGVSAFVQTLGYDVLGSPYDDAINICTSTA